MASPKTIVVLGSTGNQGGSVVETFLKESPAWHIRGITRNKSSAKAQALAANGVEVVEADMNEPLTLAAAFKEANVIFSVSDFLGAYFDPANKTKPKDGQTLNAWVAEQEMQQLKNVIDEAAKVPTLERFVFSSLANAARSSRGKYTHVYHFDGKAGSEDYGREHHPELWAKTSTYQAGLFLNGHLGGSLSPQKNAEGTVELQCPFGGDFKLAYFVADEDAGPVTKALVENEPGKNLIAYRGWASESDIAAAISQAAGVQVHPRVISVEQWVSNLPADLALEMTEHQRYWKEFGFEAQDDPILIHPSELQPPLRLPSIADWIAKQDWVSVIGGKRTGAGTGATGWHK